MSDYQGLVTKWRERSGWSQSMAISEVTGVRAEQLQECADELAEVIARNVQPSPDRISIEVFQSDWRPGFAAFLDDGSLAEGAPAHVILNIGSLLSAVESKDLDSCDLPYLIAETLMHEVIHCLEAWAKVEFSEDRVEELLTKYREKYARATIWEYTGAPPHEAENPQEARPVQQPDSKLRQAVELFLTRCGTANATDFVLAINDLKGAL